MAIQERYTPIPIAANSTNEIPAQGVGGFLCSVSGTITLTRKRELGTTQTLLSAFAVVAGIYYPLPFNLGVYGGTFTTASGAAGLLGIS